MHFTNVAECQRAAPTAPPTGARWRIPYIYITSSTGGLPSSLPLRQLYASSYVSSPACLWPSGSRCERGCEGKRNTSVLRWLVLAIVLYTQPTPNNQRLEKETHCCVFMTIYIHTIKYFLFY